MTMIMMVNGLLICLVFMWTSLAAEPAHGPEVYGDERHLSVQLRRRACRNLEGRCVKNRKACPKRLPLETETGRPYCSRKRRCCYPGIDECEDGFTLSEDQSSCTDDFLVTSSCEFICDDDGPVNISSCDDMEFRLYNSTSEDYNILINNNITSVDSSSFNASLPLLVVVHGYQENATNTSTWMHQVKNKWLEKMAMNVILVQWAKLAGKYNYCQAVKNTKCVGTKLANLINFLERETELSLSGIHIIGFSLGAQLAGVAGHLVKNLSRITGLDPAGPGFYKVDLSDRLDKEDATFVDIIHANGGCIWKAHAGFYPQCGHVDFYVNGGKFQPVCPTISTNDLVNLTEKCVSHPEECMDFVFDEFACSHDHAHRYYVDSLSTTEPSYGYQCENYATFEKGLCLNNPKNTIGFEVKSGPTGIFYSKTQATSTLLPRSVPKELSVSGDNTIIPNNRDAFVGDD